MTDVFDEFRDASGYPSLPELRAKSAEIITDTRPTPTDIRFQHTIFCQTALPYRNPGTVRSWERTNGSTWLRVDAGVTPDQVKGRYEELGLPYGPKPRLLLTYLNSEAIRTGDPEIHVAKSLGAFVSRLGLAHHGRNLNLVREQLLRLTNCTFHLSHLNNDGRVDNYRLNLTCHDRTRAESSPRGTRYWQDMVTLSADYFSKLKDHCVPLDLRAIRSLQNNALALDIYGWLAQRLWRIPSNVEQWISWVALMDQFGQGYVKMKHFKESFRSTLRLVLTQYPAAKIVEDPNRGYFLHESPPPVQPRTIIPVTIQLPL